MKIIVAVKQLIDPNIRIQLRPDGSGVDMSNARLVMNPFDEIAVEEALRLREAGKASEVILVSVGPASVAETLRAGFAMGADWGIQVQTDQRVEPLGVAKLLKAVVAEIQPGLVLLGKQAIDDDANQTGQMLAGLLGWPQATFASKLVLDENAAVVTREVDGGLQTLRLALPAIVTADLRLNQPRYASLPNIMKAKKKPIEMRTPEQLGVDIAPRHTVLSVREPDARTPGTLVHSVDDLVDRLRNEAGVI